MYISAVLIIFYFGQTMTFYWRSTKSIRRTRSGRLKNLRNHFNCCFTCTYNDKFSLKLNHRKLIDCVKFHKLCLMENGTIILVQFETATELFQCCPIIDSQTV